MDELVKSLRICADGEHCDQCAKWDIKQNGGRNACEYATCTEAANAIEELSMKLHGDEAAIAGMKREIERMVVSGNEPHWIPVTERLPEKNGSYLVYVYGEVTEMNCWHGKWHRLGDDYTKAVSHWMPLPEPPKEE